MSCHTEDGRGEVTDNRTDPEVLLDNGSSYLSNDRSIINCRVVRVYGGEKKLIERVSVYQDTIITVVLLSLCVVY